jgi:hypothetical protein
MPRGVQGRRPNSRRVETVHVLARIDPVDQPARVRDARQRQLDQDAVDLGIGIELVDQLQQLAFSGAGRHVVIESLDAHLLRRTALVAHVHGAGRVAAHQDHGQSGAGLAGVHARVDPLLELVQEILGDTAAIEDAGGHGSGHRVAV